MSLSDQYASEVEYRDVFGLEQGFAGLGHTFSPVIGWDDSGDASRNARRPLQDLEVLSAALAPRMMWRLTCEGIQEAAQHCATLSACLVTPDTSLAGCTEAWP